MPREKFKKVFFPAAAIAAFAVFTGYCSLNTAETRESGTDTQPDVEAPEPEISGAELGFTPVSNTAALVFDPASITPAVYNETKEDIGVFIDNLNLIIRMKRYNDWLTYLDEAYYDFINSPDYLQTASNSNVLTAKKIVLTNVYDYFINVVVPARSNDRVDDIEFINWNRVRAITVYNGRRIILYDLEKRQDGWKIVMPNSTHPTGE